MTPLHSLTPILTSRFILNLRQVGQGADTPSLSAMSMSAFAVPESRITGNLGENLQDLMADESERDLQRDAESAGEYGVEPATGRMDTGIRRLELE